MKLKRFLALVVSVAMVLSMVPAISLTVSAAETTYSVTAVGHSGSASGTGVFVGSNSTSANGSSTAAPKTSATNNGGSPVGSNRIGFVSFTVPVPAQEILGATMRLHVTDANNNIGSSWMRMAAYRTTGVPTEVKIGGMTDSQYLAVGDDYSYDAAYWSNEQIYTDTNAWITFDVTEALKAAVSEATGENATLSFRLQVPTAGANFDATGTNAPQLVVETGSTATVTWLLNETEIDSQTFALDDEGKATVPVKGYSENGSNEMYASAEQVVTGNTTITLEKVANTGTYAIGDKVEYSGTKYDILSTNLVPNGDFSYGVAGWYNSAGGVAGSAFVANANDGTVTNANNGGAADANSLWRGWATEVGKTYLFTFDSSAVTGYFAVSEKDDLTTTGDGTRIGEATVVGTNTIVYTATKPYVQINFRWIDGKSMGNFGLYEVQESATSVSVTATYTVGGETVDTVTKAYDTNEAEGAIFDAYYYSAGNGTNTLYKAATQTLSESTTIEMAPVDNWSGYAVNDSVVAGNNTPYLIKSANLIPNGNFAEGINGWYAADGSEALSSKFTTDAEAGSVYLVGNAGSGSVDTLQRSWAIESGKTYIFVYTQSRDDTDRKWQRFSLGNDFKSNNDCMLLGAGANDVETGQSVVLGTNIVAFTNTDGYQYANFVAAWNGGTTLSNFGLYEAEVDEARVANTTIKFVDSANNATEIQDSVTVKGVVGDTINLADVAPAIIEYNGKYYTRDNTNVDSYVAEGNENTVTVTYTLDPITSFTGTPVTVIEGNVPVLSETVMGATDGGIETTITGIVWEDCSNLTAGTHTVNGTATVAGEVVNGTVEVTVLPMSFAPGDLANNGTITFPVKLYGDFYVEFDLTATNYDNEWIYIGADGNLWGDGQIGLGWDADDKGLFRAQPEAQTDIVFETNKTYRFLVHGNVDTDTYSLTIYDTVTKEAVFTCADYGFRKVSDYVNTIAVSSNGQAGSAALSNVKVYSEAVKPSTVTFEYINNGTVINTVVQNTYTGETAKVAAGEFDGTDGARYYADAAEVAVTEAAHTVRVVAIKLETVTVNYVYNEETIKTLELYGNMGTVANQAAFRFAKDTVVYDAPVFNQTIDAENPTYTVEVTIVDNTIAATKSEIYNYTAGEVISYPNRKPEMVGTDAIYSAGWGDVRYSEMVFDVTAEEGSAIAHATLTLTPFDRQDSDTTRTFDIYAVAPSNYSAGVDVTTLARVGNGEFTDIEVPVTVSLDLYDFDASEGLMLIFKMTDGLMGVYGASFDKAPYLTYEVKEKTEATFTYVCEGTEVGSVTVRGFVGDAAHIDAGYYVAEDGTKYFVDASSITLTDGENTAEVNARKIEKVTINYTIDGEVVKTAVLEGFAGNAVVAKDVYVNRETAVYWYEAKEYTLVDGGSEFEVELTVVDNAKFAYNTETYNATTGEVITYPTDRAEILAGSEDAMLSVSWNDNRYGEMLFDVKTTGDDVIKSARLTLTPGDVMGGQTNNFNIYAAKVDTYGTTNNLEELPVVGSGTFTTVDTPITVDLDLSAYEAADGLMLIFKITSGLVGVYGESFGDKAPRLEYTIGEPGARVDVADDFVIEYAKGTIAEFDALNPPVTIPEGSNGYLDINTAWEGISGTNSDGISHIDVYAASVNEPIIRVVSELSAGIGEDSTPSVITTPGYGEGAEYVLFSFNPEVGTAPWTDIGLRDIDGKLITAFRMNNAETDVICPVWGHIGTASPYKTYYTNNEYSINPAGEAKATITDLVSQVDVIMRNFDPDGEAGTGDEYYTAAFSVDGNVFAVGTYEGNFNGLKDIEMACAGATVDQYGGIAAVHVYSGNEPRIVGSITANYIFEDIVVHSATKYYDKNDYPTGIEIEFPEFYYSALGSSLLYRVPAQTLTENTDIQVVQYHPTTNVVTTLIHNWSHDNLRPSDLYTNEETGLTYMIATRNLIPNGNFEHGVEAWYNGMLGEPSDIEFVPNAENETVIIRANGTTTSEYGFYNAWAIEKGETYLFTYKATGLNETYAGISQTDVATPVSYDPTVATPLVNGENQIVFEAESDYLKLNVGWSKDAEIGSFGLYKLEMIRTGDIHRTIIQGNTPMLPTHVAPEVDGEVHAITWDQDAIDNLQLGNNTVTGVCEEGHTVTATVIVYPQTFTVADYTSYDGQYGLTSNDGNVKFEKPVTGKFAIEMDVTVEEYGDLWIILNDSAKTNDTSFFGSDQIIISPSYFGGEVYPQDGNKDGTRNDLTQLMVAGRDKPYRFLIRGNCELGNYTVTITTPEGVTRTVAKYGFRTMSDKLDSIAMFTNSDGTGKFKATNIRVYDVDPIDVQYILQKDGAEDKELTVEELGEYFYGEEVVLPDGKFYLSYHDETLPAYNNDAEADNVAHIVKTTEEQTFTVTPEHSETPHTVYVAMHKENAVLYDTFATATDAELNDADNLLFIGSNGVSDIANFDADGEAVIAGVDKYVGAPRIPLLTFNVPEFNEGEVVMLNLYAYQANHLLGIGNSTKLAANTVDTLVDEATVYNPEDVANTENLVWSDNMIVQTEETLSDGRYTVRDDTRRVAMDVTDLVIKAKAEGKEQITFALYSPVAGAYVMNREATTYGAVHQGDFAAFLEVENDTYTITVNGASLVTKGGSMVQLVDENTTTVHLRNDKEVKMYTDEASHVVFAEADNIKIHNIATETTDEGAVVRRATVTSETIVDDGVYMPYSLGADMVNGAQVRIGGGVDENGQLVGGSGLRFITVVNAADTLASFVLEDDTMEIGVKITAEDSDKSVYVPAEMWQTDGQVFTTALTNLAISNYNRNYTAVPYIKCTDASGEALEFTNAPVTRSVYKVAAGLLSKGYDTESDDNGVDTDGNYKDDMGDETDYSSMPENLVAVLNTYVNKTGVRLTLSDNSETATLTARTTGSGAYTGEAFFTVGETTYENGKYTVTLTAVGQAVINTEMFNQYVRINNNNSKVSPVTEITDNGDGTYTIVFDYSNM